MSVKATIDALINFIDTAGVDVGGTLGAIAPSLTLVAIGAIIGCLVSLIFER